MPAVWTNWRTSGIDPYLPPHNSCSPNLIGLRHVADEHFDLPYLGCHHDRNARFLSSLSVHAWGAALDVGKTDGTGSREQRDRFIAFLLWASDRTGIMQIHDYERGIVWKSNRDAWRQQEDPPNPDDADAWNARWATYIHVEVNTHFFGVAVDWQGLYEMWMRGDIDPQVPDMIDISQYNLITSWGNIPSIPIFHRTVGVYASEPGGDAVADTMFASRFPVIEARSHLFGAYCTLADSVSGQYEMHCDMIEPFVRDGYSTQWDCEPWKQGHAAPSIHHIEAAVLRHDERFGVDRWSIYINPYELPHLYDEVKARWPDFVHWMPGYRADESDKLERYNPAIHQYTSAAEVPGFHRPIDGNTLRRPEDLIRISTQPFVPPPVGEVTDMLGTHAHNSVRILNDARLNPDGHAHLPEPYFLIPVAENTPDDAQAVSILVTARNAAGEGHLTVWSGEGDAPGTSLINHEQTGRSNNSMTVPVITAPNGLRAFAIQIFGADITVDIDQYAYLTKIEYPAVGVPPHNHDEQYARLGHGHNYAAKNHDHDDDYAAAEHGPHHNEDQIKEFAVQVVVEELTD